ncbi:hypothetical protein K1T35_47500 (plasmid) [Pseudonocardia sp. DSM 110487]|uniref:hypothetical protein n=1 Tax=Pseudonocardia sp. DSM 110487 TaxID=2865833 RepID=UPI001C6A8A15|nr:hypothetical protein [Pseudonocardia sp. DSM 110487]QYN40996.1 hypothetical protein K1T35_47500 [Pseudonocardia sp. DSM 110487]
MNEFFAYEQESDAPPAERVVLVGVIEWSSDSGEEPRVTLASTPEPIYRWFRDQVSELELDDVEPAPPQPDCSDQELFDWMQHWREATTEAWLTIFPRPLP